MTGRKPKFTLITCLIICSTTMQARAQVVGAEIVGNNQRGAAAEVISNGLPGQPSIGLDVSATGAPGQSVTGLRVIQNGPGTGLRVIQNGPGIGVRSTVTVGPDNNLTH